MRKIFLLSTALLLASCENAAKPAPILNYGGDSAGGSAGMVTVIPGDTPESLAADYHVAPNDLLTANSLSAGAALAPGQRLRLPAPWTYKAQEGDTPESVAHLFNVEPAQVARLNNLAVHGTFRSGQTVALRVAEVPHPASPSGYAATSPGVMSVPNDMSQLPPQPQANNAPMPILPADRDIATSSTVDEVSRDITTEPPLPLQKVAPLPLRPTHDTGLPPDIRPWQDGNGRFAWPVNGPIASTYGNKPGGLHNDGINIAGARGTPVRAAAGGEVVYAGNDLKGFGNLVLVRHPDRWATAYAHLDHLAVTRGDNVTRGQVLGSVGSTGAVSSPQLHFEIRHGTEALNPVVFLGKVSP